MVVWRATKARPASRGACAEAAPGRARPRRHRRPRRRPRRPRGRRGRAAPDRGGADRPPLGRGGPGPLVSTVSDGRCRSLSRSACSGPGQEEAVADQRDGAEERRCGDEVDRQGHTETSGGCSQQTTGNGTDAPHAVEGVDDGAPVATLDSQAVGVLRHVDHCIQRAGHEQDDGQRGPQGVGDRHERQHRRHDDDAPDGNPRRSEAVDESSGEETGQQGAEREGCDRRAQRRVRQAQVVLDLGVAGQEVGEERAVGEEERRDRDAGMAADADVAAADSCASGATSIAPTVTAVFSAGFRAVTVDATYSCADRSPRRVHLVRGMPTISSSCSCARLSRLADAMSGSTPTTSRRGPDGAKSSARPSRRRTRWSS